MRTIKQPTNNTRTKVRAIFERLSRCTKICFQPSGLGTMGTKDYIRCFNRIYTNFIRFTEMNLAKITAIVTLIFIALVSYYIWWPFQPVIMLDYPIPVQQSVVKAGEKATLKYRFIKQSECTPDVKYYLVDGFVLELSNVGAIKRPMGEQSIVRDIPIPTSAPQTKVHLRIEYSCRVNPLRTITYSWDTESFIVVE